jgi:exopolysaccharide biosynthesis polyprenyl glycosylphosphotransferase
MPRSGYSQLVIRTLDLACILAALSAAGLWRNLNTSTTWGTLEPVAHVGVFWLIWMLVADRLALDAIPLRGNRTAALRRAAETWATTWGIGGLSSIGLPGHPPIEVWTLLGVGLLLLAGYRLAIAGTSLGLSTDRPRTLVIGACAGARSLTASGRALSGMDFVGFVGIPGEEEKDMTHLPHLGSANADLPAMLQRHRIDLALVSPADETKNGEVHRVIKTCDQLGLGVQYFPPFLDIDHLRVGTNWREGRSAKATSAPPSQTLAQFAKRGIDVAGSLLGIAALLPVFVACALAVKVTSRGPVFFRQERVGKGGARFDCLKFRTMFVGAHTQQETLRTESTQDGPAFKIPEDPRVTRVGRMLRKFSLDELPQMFNVLMGDMSLVGPRPPIPSEVEKYTWWQRRRIAVKPGLTCVWQVYGRNRVTFKRWVEMDLYYIDNWSLWLDLKLIAHTFRVVLQGTGM